MSLKPVRVLLDTPRYDYCAQLDSNDNQLCLPDFTLGIRAVIWLIYTLEWHMQDKYNGLSFTMERPRTCPLPFLCWPFNCTILCPLKLFVRSTDGELALPPTHLLILRFIIVVLTTSVGRH